MNIPFSDELIAKYLSGESIQQESTEIENWIKSDSEHQEWFESYKELWNKTYPKEEIPENYLKPDWESFEKKYSLNDKKTPRLIFYSAAAILLISTLIFQYLNFDKAVVIESQLAFKEIVLPDHSKITLNYNSKLRYSEDFGKNNRELHLDGEAFFDVASNKDLPFIIKTEKAITTVVGTAFNLKSRGDLVHLTVTEGIVNFYAVNVKEEVRLIAGEESIIEAGKAPSKPKKTDEKNLNLSWLKKQLIFKDAYFSDIIRELKLIYKKDIELSHEIENLKVTAVINYNKPLDLILKQLSTSLRLKLETQKDRFRFKK